MATSAAGMHLFVVGGTGYIGREVVKAAVKRGYRVTSLSRSARAKIDENVTFLRGDATKPHTYVRELKKCQAAVYCTGELIGWQENPVLKRAYATLMQGLTQTEIQKRLYEDSFQKKNYDGAIEVGKQLASFSSPDSHRQMFYVSAAMNPIFNVIAPDYFRYKQQAENELLALRHLDSISCRPGVVTSGAIRTVLGLFAGPIGGKTRLDVLVRFILDSLENPHRYNKIYDRKQIRDDIDVATDTCKQDMET